MEEKKYEAGKVEISSAEYRDLVTKAVEAHRDFEVMISEKWKVEDEKRKLSEELASANKKIAELESVLGTLQTGLRSQYISTPNPTETPCNPWWTDVTCSSNNKEGN